MNVDALVFDVLGTMVDEPAGVLRELGDPEAAARWASDVEEQQADVVAGRRPFTELPLATVRLDPWPDAVAGLARLATRFPVVALSNATRADLARLSQHAGLRWHLALSATEARSYKPDPAVYRMAVDALGLPPERLLMVAAHAWDLRGAQAAGLCTAYVARPVGDPPSPEDTFDLTASGLDDLAGQLGVPAPPGP